jgi:Flp pilus assembly protein TadG
MNRSEIEIMKLSRMSRQRQSFPNRRGVAVVEGAVVLASLFVVLFGMLDLSLLVLESNTLAEAARRLCRTAVVHGLMASPQMTVWGPTTVSGTAGDGTEYAQALNPELVTFILTNVNYVINWPDGGNQPGNRVQVTASYQYQPMMPLILGSSPIPVTVATTMQVAH